MGLFGFNVGVEIGQLMIVAALSIAGALLLRWVIRFERRLALKPETPIVQHLPPDPPDEAVAHIRPRLGLGSVLRAVPQTAVGQRVFQGNNPGRSRG